MGITTYQVQNILRTYGKQLSRGKKKPRLTPDSLKARAIADQVNISSDAKRRQVINKITQEIIGQLTGQIQSRGPLEKEALSRLSKEYGRPLEVFEDRDGNVRFAVVDGRQRTIVEELSSEESQELSRRLSEITKAIVDENMVS